MQHLQLDFNWIRPSKTSEFRVFEGEAEPLWDDDVLAGYRAEAMGSNDGQAPVVFSSHEKVLLCFDRVDGRRPGQWERFAGDELPPDLFLEFARLDSRSIEQVLDFANRYGPLGLRTRVGLDGGVWTHGDALAVWRLEHDAMKRMVALWRELADPISTRNPLVVPKPGQSSKGVLAGDLVEYGTRPLRAFIHLKARGSQAVQYVRIFDEAKGVNLALVDLVREKDSWQLLQSYVAQELSNHLADCTFGVVLTESDGVPAIKMTPRARTLIAWMWYQASHMWSIDSDYRVCKWCGMPFLALPRTRRKPGVEPERRHRRARADLVYHPECQVRAFRARSDGVDDLDGIGEIDQR